MSQADDVQPTEGTDAAATASTGSGCAARRRRWARGKPVIEEEIISKELDDLRQRDARVHEQEQHDDYYQPDEEHRIAHEACGRLLGSDRPRRGYRLLVRDAVDGYAAAGVARA